MIPEWKWDRVTMDFVSGLPFSPKKKDVIWVVVDRLTKSAHFIPVRTDFSLDKLAELYISENLKLHGVPLSIVLDRDPNLLRDFGRNCKKLWVQNCILVLRFTHKQMENPNELFKYLRICCVVAFLSLKEALYGRKCRTSLYWSELSENKIHGVDMIRETEEKSETSDRQKLYANLKLKDIEFQIGDKMFLNVSLWKKILWFSQKGKLSPRFIGLYEIIKRIGPVSYRLSLPSELEKIHNVFHSDMSYAEETIRILACEIKELRNKKITLVKVLWHRHEF
ncbi:Gag-Pol polyprotein [Gossypium australe]|uniref:Gag-Pol polyprotein n=1 Tax=Gossypium australe TaxID=47621 RepID=A0A5B6VMR7_9ROSI|nr:Gag-Pol polyprotein [Gossypium australe]